MEKENKLLYSFSGVAGIFFPVGKLKNGGTCEFSTEICLDECAAFKNATKDNIIPYEIKLRIYNEISKNPIGEIISQILTELDDLKTNILYWFASGDCPKKLTKKLAMLIIKLSKEHVIIQQGFTRNKELWRRVRKEEDVRLCLTVENGKIKNEDKAEGALFAIPDYSTGGVKILGYNYYISNPRFEYQCPGLYQKPYKNPIHTGYESKKLKLGNSCKICYEKKIGCHTELKTKEYYKDKRGWI